MKSRPSRCRPISGADGGNAGNQTPPRKAHGAVSPGSGLGQSSASIDGITTDDLQMGNQVSPLTGYVDSFEEVRIDSVNNTAEFGTVGNVSVPG